VAGAVLPTAAASVRLSSPNSARWPVTDATGGPWFADRVPHKWDVHHRPFFHGGTVTVAVPAVPWHVVAARGSRFDPAADGCYGGDLRAHLNYRGDHVLAPADAGADAGGSLVYDRELPGGHRGIWPGRGSRFCNDLLAHVRWRTLGR
jgi:hypothetical protein